MSMEGYIMDAPICCPPRVDRFLAISKVKPMGPEEPRITVEELRRMESELAERLYSDEKMPEGFWD